MQEIVIKIPNSLYANLKKIKGDSIAGKRIVDCVINGTVLPKRHGKLIDSNILKRHIDKLPCLPDGNFAGNHSALKALINMQPTIIEADRSEK